MAKTKICPICGKEYESGFFKSASGGLAFGKIGMNESLHAFNCCASCSETYRDISNEEGERFAAKVTNLMRARKIRRLTEQQIATLFLKYVKQQREPAAFDINDFRALNVAHVLSDGRFFIAEADTSSTEFTARSYRKAVKKMHAFNPRHIFSRDDISMLQYRRKDSNIVGLFTTIYTYEIRLNDEKNMTFKPCIAKIFVVGRGLFVGRNASRKMRRYMEEFRAAIGSDLEITKVKKFK